MRSVCGVGAAMTWIMAVGCEPVIEGQDALLPLERAAPASFGTLVLSAPDSVYAGERNLFTVDGAHPGERVYLVRGQRGDGGPCFPFLGGNCFTIGGPVALAGQAFADPSGVATFDMFVAGLYGGSGFGVQAVAVRGIFGVDTAFSTPAEFTTVGRDTDGDGIPDSIDDCPLGEDSDGDTVCDSEDVCPGGDDRVDSNGDGLVDDCPYRVCADVLAQDPAALSGVYPVDPDGSGGMPAYEAWCDMELHGGGWMLVLARERAQEDVQVDGVLIPSMSSRAVRDDRWQVLRTEATEALGLTDAGTEFVADLATLRSANCQPLAMSLTEYMLASNETSGCSGSGNDYSQWFGFRGALARNTVMWNTSSVSFYPSGGNVEPDAISMYVR